MTDNSYREQHCSNDIFDDLDKLEEMLNDEFIELPCNLSDDELLSWLNDPINTN